MSAAKVSADASAFARKCVVAAGLASSIAFVIVGVACNLIRYGDGAIFSYAVAAQDVWAFHWHNIAVRATPWLLAMAPAEAFIAASGDPSAGIALYGALFFSAEAAGLAATFALDRSQGRLIFVFACASTACFCPLVFGFPTEMWFAHALFWPALAAAFDARTPARCAFVFVLMLALMLSHEGALLLAAEIVAGLALRGLRDRAFICGALAFGAALAVWLCVNAFVRPDDYFAAVRIRAALEFFDARIFGGPLVALLAATLAAYGALSALLVWRGLARAHLAAGALVLAALALYWWRWDTALHADNRYYARTILLLATGASGASAILFALNAGGAPRRIASALDLVCGALARCVPALAGALALVLIVHVVETAKFVRAFGAYRAAVRALATGSFADPQLGDPAFVASTRIDRALDRLAWFSTTPYLAAIEADFRPARLVVDPAGNYFWISCATARANEARRILPDASAALVSAYACAHQR